jgi:hypothetical protein
VGHPGTGYGLTRDTLAAERMARRSDWFGAYRDDRMAGG